jgi:hypothetical protein
MPRTLVQGRFLTNERALSMSEHNQPSQEDTISDSKDIISDSKAIISNLEKELQTDFDSHRFHKLIQSKVDLYQAEGLTVLVAKKKAYQEAIDFLERQEQIMGLAPDYQSLRHQYNHALITFNNVDGATAEDDPFLQKIHGVQIAFLKVSDVDDLSLADAQQYRNLAKAVQHQRDLFGNRPDLSELYFKLLAKAREMESNES